MQFLLLILQMVSMLQLVARSLFAVFLYTRILYISPIQKYLTPNGFYLRMHKEDTLSLMYLSVLEWEIALVGLCTYFYVIPVI